MTFLAKIADFVLPPRCIVTGEIVDKQGMVSPAAWQALNFISDPKCDCCGFPFEFDLEGVNDGHLCASCLKFPPRYDKARSALIYDDASRDIILGFKHGDQTQSIPTFTPWLLRVGRHIFEDADFLIPVPLHPTRLVRRRFNQAGLMAQAISKQANIPVLHDGLKRLRATPTQGHLDFGARRKNVRKAFGVHPRHQEKLSGKKIVLIDDVFTTGATVSECTKVLQKNNVASVNILTLARVVRPERF